MDHVCCQVGKEKALPQLLGSNADPDSNTEQQFEVELQWCIQQLEGALATNKMAPKHGKLSLQTLQNSSVFWSLTSFYFIWYSMPNQQILPKV
jgi:hypothetical protein